jgi:hypothetical protein
MKMMRWFSGLVIVVALLAGACGNGGGEADGPPATGRGWLGGEPAWGGGSAEGPEGFAAASRGGEDAARMSSETADGDIVGPEPVPVPGAGALRAGSVDDNADFDRYLAYLGSIHSLGIPLRDLDPTGRIVIAVTGSNGLPVAGAEVVVSVDGSPIARVRTTADGTVRFHPALYGAADAQELEIAAGGQTITVAPGSTVELTANQSGGADGPVAIDILFLLDATGSMGDEIDRLKTSIDSVAARISALEPAPDVRFAMTLYRDLDDDFVTATYDFTVDVDAFRAALADVRAEGGGDYPEALDEGLAEALTAPAWRDPATTIQLVFLVADAPPQIGREVAVAYPQSIVDAISRGVKIFPIASSDSDDQAEAVFRQLAQTTGARFVFLSYGAAGAATGGSTDIASTDYEELALDDLVVRLVGEELAALTGQEFRAPAGSTTTTTRPQGQ